jgi:DMSO/TMAO reductase YedYZ molybdopterin-dependent catalytic subunit
VDFALAKSGGKVYNGAKQENARRGIRPPKEDAMKTRCLMLFVSVAGFTFAAAPLFAAGTAPAKAVEIREYQGVKLGSVNDFQENSIEGVQRIDIRKYRLAVDGLTERKASFTYEELLAKPHIKRLVELNCVEGWTVRALWEGIPLRELFKAVQPRPEAVTVIFHSTDGYTTSQPLKDIIDRDLILADRINGMILPPEQGYPFILVAQEKWGYKWARWVTRIELSANPDYRGYWESNGFSGKGDLNGPIYDR